LIPGCPGPAARRCP